MSPDSSNVIDGLSRRHLILRQEYADLLDAACALAAPEPEPFWQVRPSPEDNARWQRWRDRTTEAQRYVEALDAQ
jgi:hypothetical protein